MMKGRGLRIGRIARACLALGVASAVAMVAMILVTAPIYAILFGFKDAWEGLPLLLSWVLSALVAGMLTGVWLAARGRPGADGLPGISQLRLLIAVPIILSQSLEAVGFLLDGDVKRAGITVLTSSLWGWVISGSFEPTLRQFLLRGAAIPGEAAAVGLTSSSAVPQSLSGDDDPEGKLLARTSEAEKGGLRA